MMIILDFTSLQEERSKDFGRNYKTTGNVYNNVQVPNINFLNSHASSTLDAKYSSLSTYNADDYELIDRL